MKVFMDSEFTGLHQRSTLISIGLFISDEESFYAEFNDYETGQINHWLTRHVISQLEFSSTNEIMQVENRVWKMKGDRDFVRKHLENWFAAYNQVEIWADCYAWDWILFCELWGGSLNLPQNIFYIPMDLATLFKIKGFPSDISRLEFAADTISGLTGVKQHHALWDARVQSCCYQKLIDND